MYLRGGTEKKEGANTLGRLTQARKGRGSYCSKPGRQKKNAKHFRIAALKEENNEKQKYTGDSKRKKEIMTAMEGGDPSGGTL